MRDQEKEQSIRSYSDKVTNKSYLELLEKHILSDKCSDLDNKHKEWSKFISELN